MKNLNKNTWLIYRGYVEKNKPEYIKELRAKGYKLTGNESVNKITELVLGIHKSQVK